MTDDADFNAPITELRLRYTTDGMVELIGIIDHMRLGELPEVLAMFLVHASNVAQLA